MTDADLVDRLADLSALAQIPREELEWLSANGHLEVWEAGTIVAPKDERIENMWVLLSGHIAIRVDRGAGLHRVTEWRVGDIGGMLPYSRMTGPPGDTYLEQKSEILLVHEKRFPEMILQCPVFTAHTVHTMLDRARTFNTSDLQDEKMVSLGKLAAGLAHELNNPASATMRSAKLLRESLAKADSAARALGAAMVNGEIMDAIKRTRAACIARPIDSVLSPIEQADREDEISEWLARHHSDPAHATPLAETAVTIETLNGLAEALSGKTLDAALHWIATGCATHSLAIDIERAATRIHDLVAAVKRFTYMDRVPGTEPVDVETGLRDTIRVVASKAKSKGAAIGLNIDPALPRVLANGGELNQVWLNLIDNALDAIAESGHVDISARRELDRIVVRVVDDGHGIPQDIMPQIFDPFFTTKPPGQGTGLGLDVTRRLLRRSQGDISFDSRPGRTEVRVSLPLQK